jgi:hypothetical protein
MCALWALWLAWLAWLAFGWSWSFFDLVVLMLCSAVRSCTTPMLRILYCYSVLKHCAHTSCCLHVIAFALLMYYYCLSIVRCAHYIRCAFALLRIAAPCLVTLDYVAIGCPSYVLAKARTVFVCVHSLRSFCTKCTHAFALLMYSFTCPRLSSYCRTYIRCTHIFVLEYSSLTDLDVSWHEWT